MASIEETFRALKKRVDDAEREHARSIGAYESAMARLKNLGFDSIEDADKELDRLDVEIEADVTALKERMQKIQDDLDAIAD